MSLTRQFFREVAPLFRLLDQPLGRFQPIYGGRSWNRFMALRDLEAYPAIDVIEQGDNYVLNAELPGVDKQDIEVRVGDGGRSITIEGKVNSSQSIPDSKDTAGKQPSKLLIEREFGQGIRFARTVWLPSSVDKKDVSAKMGNGLLTILAKKTEDKATAAIPID